MPQLSGVKLRMSVRVQKLSDGAGSRQSLCLGWLARVSQTPTLQTHHSSVLSKYLGFLQKKKKKEKPAVSLLPEFYQNKRIKSDWRKPGDTGQIGKALGPHRGLTRVASRGY